MVDARTEMAIGLMGNFAARTGLGSSRPARRYLWTDAFAACNFLGLRRLTGNARFDDLALRLVADVHHELGRHRKDDRRIGWISGLSASEGEAHPTLGGLRIGKPLPERGPNEPIDPELEWERDGQYFHYLTKWMHALDRVARATGDAKFNRWARELAFAAHDAFVFESHGEKRMAWKLSVDLSRPLVSSMGQHDPLDGLVTCRQLDATATSMNVPLEPDLSGAISDFADMTDPSHLATNDPLGLGGLLLDACRLVQLDVEPRLAASLRTAARAGAIRYASGRELRAPAARRLAFRELGLAIGLAGASMLELDGFADLAPLRSEIESFWLRPESRRASTWTEHEDINDVMLATSLAPDGFVRIR